MSASFNLSASVSQVADCAELLFEAHLAYNDADEASNMAVLEVDMLSGYEPVKSSLDELRQDPTVSECPIFIEGQSSSDVAANLT